MKWLFALLCFLPIVGWGQTNPFCGSYTPHAPIVLTNDNTPQTFTGLVITANPGAPCVNLTNCSNKTFINCKFLGNCLPNQDPARIGIVTFGSHDITVFKCYFEKVASGVYFQVYSGATANMKVDSCWFSNMTGSYPRGEAVQFNQISGAGSEVIGNSIENLAGVSAPQDNISMFKSNGTPTSNIIVQGNKLRGSGVTNASNSGVILGDGGGSYQSAINNIIVNAGHVELAIVGGNNMTAYGNTLYTSDPTIINPVLVQINNATYPATTCTNVILQNNIGQYTRGVATYFQGAPFNCSPFTNIDNNYNSTINPNIIPPLPGCTVNAPVIAYSPSVMSYTQFINISPITPSNTGSAATSWAIVPALPIGLSFSTTTGTISGTPLLAQTLKNYTVSAVNSAGQGHTGVSITITAAGTSIIRVPGRTSIVLPPH